MAESLVLKEQRTLVRRELIYYLKVVDIQTGQELGRLGDLHAEGMLIFSDRSLVIGAVYHAALELPKALAGDLGFAELPFRGETVWTRTGPKASNYFESGLRFLNLPAKALVVFDQLIEIFAMPGR